MDNQTKIEPKIINILILIFLTEGEERPLFAHSGRGMRARYERRADVDKVSIA